MKQVSPISFRVGYSLPWKTSNKFLNDIKTVRYQLVIFKWLFSICFFFSRNSKKNPILCYNILSNFSIYSTFFLYGIWVFFKRARNYLFKKGLKKKKIIFYCIDRLKFF